MNKDVLHQFTTDEQSIALSLNSAAENMYVSPSFQWDLETQLMEKYKTKSQPVQGWTTKIIPALGWALLALAAVYLLNLTIRPVVTELPPAEGITSVPKASFENDLRQGKICTGPLALAHNFSVYLTNQDKTGFEMLDENRTIGELLSFAWSPDGQQLAVLGNTAGNGNIYLTNVGEPLQAVISNSEVGYLRDIAWSQDGKQLLIWSSQNNMMVYLVNADGSGLVEKQLNVQILGTPQFTQDGKAIVFYGADSSSSGLFEVSIDGSQTRLINSLVENESSFGWSPDGRYIAYFIVDRTLGEALLLAEEFESGEKTVLATLPIPKGLGSSIPDVANLSWSQDGTKLVFEFGRSESDRAIYLAYVDGTELVKLADSAHAPAISADGKCLAFIRDKQVFLLDLTGISLTSNTATPILLADIPPGRSMAGFQLDKLQWRP